MRGDFPNRPFSEEALARALRPLAEAATLPSEAFTSGAVYAQEVEAVFRAQWLCVGREDQVASAGDYLCVDLLGERLVVVRGKDEAVRVLSRICRHRGAELIKGQGTTRSFSCPYHAWTYHLDGRLGGAPHMEGVAAFAREDLGLAEFRSESWEGFLFVNLDGKAAPLGEALAPLSDFISHYKIAGKKSYETATFESPFNWKVLVDNFMEAYHHAATHRNTLQPTLPGERSWVPDNEGPYSILVMPGRDAPETREKPDGSDPAMLLACVVYPFHLFAVSDHSTVWYQLFPRAHDDFTLKIFACFADDDLPKVNREDLLETTGKILTAIHLEDIEACEATWAGLNTRTYTQGRLSLLEKTIWQFNQWWAETMIGPHSKGSE